MTGATRKQAAEEVAASVERIFYYAAYADKYEGARPRNAAARGDAGAP